MKPTSKCPECSRQGTPIDFAKDADRYRVLADAFRRDVNLGSSLHFYFKCRCGVGWSTTEPCTDLEETLDEIAELVLDIEILRKAMMGVQ